MARHQDAVEEQAGNDLASGLISLEEYNEIIRETTLERIELGE